MVEEEQTAVGELERVLAQSDTDHLRSGCDVCWRHFLVFILGAENSLAEL